MPALSEETQRTLTEITPTAGTSVRNPVDTSVGWGPQGLKPMLDTIRIVADAPNIDFVLYHTSWSWGPNRSGGPNIIDAATESARKIGELAAEVGKPIVCVARIPTTETGMGGTLAFQQVLAQHGIAVFNSVQAASLALQRLLAWQERTEFIGAK
jgi:acyl-CoA synthetase (NDP forming)